MKANRLSKVIVVPVVVAMAGGCTFFPPTDRPDTPKHETPYFDPTLSPNLEMAVIQGDDVIDRLRSNFRLPALRNSEVRHYEDWHRKHPGALSQIADPGRWHLPHIAREVLQRGMPAEIALLPAIESGFDATARSPSGAAGLWQFTSATGRHFDLDQNSWLDQRLDLAASTRAALDYLEQLNHAFDGDWLLALAAYNAGEGTIRKLIDQNRMRGIGPDYRQLRLSTETRHFVPKLIALRNVLATPERFGATLPTVTDTPRFPRRTVSEGIEKQRLADICGVDFAVISQLNAAHIKRTTPPQGSHGIRLPHGCSSDFDLALSSGILQARSSDRHGRIHVVRRGDNLWAIARSHRVSLEALRAANPEVSSNLMPGEQIRIPGTASW